MKYDKDSHEKRSAQVRIRLTPSEEKYFKKLALIEGISISDLIRKSVKAEGELFLRKDLEEA